MRTQDVLKQFDNTGSTVALMAKLKNNGWDHTIKNVKGTVFCVDSLSKDAFTSIDICTTKSRRIDGIEISERFLSAHVTTVNNSFEIDTLNDLQQWLESEQFI